MGGTSMVFTGLALGIILSVSRGEQDPAWEDEEKGEVRQKRNTSNAKVAA
jgi:hypothetical protein